MTKDQKISWLSRNHSDDPERFARLLETYWHDDPAVQERHDSFGENTVSNFYLPLGVAPNFLINGKLHTLPMAIEESSVVAAASKAAKFWLDRGGFDTTVNDTLKTGQVHFMYHGDPKSVSGFFAFAKAKLLHSLQSINQGMAERGGGIKSLDLRDRTQSIPGYWQLDATFDTCDAMGANFINSSLEQLAKTFSELAQSHEAFPTEKPEVVMAILSNYVPDCTVTAAVRCPVGDLGTVQGMPGRAFAEKFVQAVEIANHDVSRAVTHNKGIMNGIDAVILATGNDFRAVESGVHAYAARNGSYASLTEAAIHDSVFSFTGTFPLALGTVGGLTSLHPLADLSLEILGHPDSSQLMQIAAACGLAQNFAAVQSLVTTGIQAGHMKMHLTNILDQMGATPDEKQQLKTKFTRRTPSHSSVREALKTLRDAE